MKHTLLIFNIVLFMFCCTTSAQESAQTVMQQSFAKADNENKNVLLLFHASWCHWCKKMDKNMTAPATEKLFSANYILTHLTVKESPKNAKLENPGGEDFLKKYKGEPAGLPFWVILDSKGNVLTDSFDSKGQNLGCPSTSEEVAEFTAKLKKTSRLNDKQLAIIKETFTIKK